MSERTHRTGRIIGTLMASMCVVGASNAQSQGGGGQLPPPAFDPALVFSVDVGHPYGLASVDFLDADGNPGQDGYPEIAVAGTGVDLFNQFLACEDGPIENFIKVYHNKGATVAWDGPTPHDALDFKQMISIDDAAPGLWATELAFADVTGDGEQDLVLVGLDPDNPEQKFGRLLVFENLGNGMFSSAPITDLGILVPLRGLVVEDFDLDGDIDVVAAAHELRDGGWACGAVVQDDVVVFQNRTVENSGTYEIILFSLEHLGVANDAAPGDIAGGDFYAYSSGTPLTDLVTPNQYATSVTPIHNLGMLDFAPDTQTPPVECSWPYITVTSGKFGANTDWDFAAVDPDDLFVDIFYGDGNGLFTSTCSAPYFLYPTGTTDLHAYGISSGRINNGPYPDLAITLGITQRLEQYDSQWYGAVAVLLGKGNGIFQPESAQQAYIFRADDLSNPDQPSATGSANLIVVDLDADGFDDIVVANHTLDIDNNSDNISVLINSLEVTGVGP